MTSYSKKYYEENKERLKERSCEKVLCDCGLYIQRCYLAKHRKTSKHFSLIYKDPNYTDDDKDRLLNIEEKKETSMSKVECDCGAMITKNFYQRHLKSDKHNLIMYKKTMKK
jgi:hypothetical protein